jgi:hypothetical protein
MKLIIESDLQEGGIRSVSTAVEADDLNVQEVVEMLFRPAMQALGYADTSLAKIIGDVDYDAFDRFLPKM